MAYLRPRRSNPILDPEQFRSTKERDIVVTYNKKQKLSFGSKIKEVMSGNRDVWWNFGRIPKLENLDRIYISYKNKIRGYFTVDYMETERKEFLISENLISEEDLDAIYAYGDNLVQIPKGWNPLQDGWIRKRYGWTLRKIHAQAHLQNWTKISAIHYPGFRGYRKRSTLEKKEIQLGE